MVQAPHPPLASLTHLSIGKLRALWPRWFDHPPPVHIRKDWMVRALAYRMQEQTAGGLSKATRTHLRQLAKTVQTHQARLTVDTPQLKPGTRFIRQWRGEAHQVTVETTGFAYRGKRYRSLSVIARTITGTRWSGPRFFGLTAEAQPTRRGKRGNGD